MHLLKQIAEDVAEEVFDGGPYTQTVLRERIVNVVIELLGNVDPAKIRWPGPPGKRCPNCHGKRDERREKMGGTTTPKLIACNHRFHES